MRFFHLADLHLGKMVNGFSLLPDQEHILQEVLHLAEEHRPAAVLLAGDIYDRATPPVEAVRLYDDFLTKLATLGITVLVIAGNHDSPERLGFAGQLLGRQSIHSYGPFEGKAHTVTLEEGDTVADFHLLPFLRPSSVRRFFPEEDIQSTQDALRLALQASPPTPGRPNVLLAHQFVTASGQTTQLSSSETRTVGGVDEVDAALFAGYDYVALGHIHGPQQMGRNTVRYAGSPLKYSFSEMRHNKSLVLVTLDGTEAKTELLPLHPLRDMREITGPFQQLISPEVVQAQNCADYLRVVLCDELDVPGAMAKLRQVYPFVMELAYEHRQHDTQRRSVQISELKRQTASELFARFYAEQNGQPPTAAQCQMLLRLLGEKEVPL